MIKATHNINFRKTNKTDPTFEMIKIAKLKNPVKIKNA